MPNPLRRGVDPYADADAAARILAPVLGPIVMDDVTANTKHLVSPVKGRVRSVTRVTNVVAGTADSATTVNVNGGATIATVTNETAGAVADVDTVDVQDTADNIVNEGDTIELVGAGGATTNGESNIQVVIEPDTNV